MEKIYIIIARLGILSLIFTFFIILFGGSMNPFIWKQQFDRRLNPTTLLDSDSSPIENLNEGFEESYSYILGLKKQNIAFLDELIVEISNIYIQSKINYKSDITNYHSIDHLATPSEILKKGADDCDGQAILTTSLLRSRGYNAYVVLGFSHVWVEVYLNNKVISLNNSKQCSIWYCKFNEKNIQWNILPLFTLWIEFFSLFFSSLSITYYLYTRNIMEYITVQLSFFNDYLYFFKYVFILLVAFLGFGAVIFAIIKVVIP